MMPKYLLYENFFLSKITKVKNTFFWFGFLKYFLKKCFCRSKILVPFHPKLKSRRQIVSWHCDQNGFWTIIFHFFIDCWTFHGKQFFSLRKKKLEKRKEGKKNSDKKKAVVFPKKKPLEECNKQVNKKRCLSLFFKSYWRNFLFSLQKKKW